MAILVIETLIFLTLVIPVSFFLVTVFVLAAFGKSLGFRKKYVECLLYIFEYGKMRIDSAKQRKNQDGHDVTMNDKNSDDSDALIESEDANCNRKNEKLIENMNNCETEKALLDSGLVETKNHINSRSLSLGSQLSETKIKGIISETNFEFSDIFEFIHSGIEAIVQDQVTQRFVAEELKSWNLLTRTNHNYEFISWRLSLIWVAGFFVRYCIMLPFRITICFVGVMCMILSTALVGILPSPLRCLRRPLYNIVCLHTFGVLASSLSAKITYHDIQNRPGGLHLSSDGTIRKVSGPGGGICVANHTSPIDVLVLACDCTYAMIGQRHGGFLGILQRALARASSHIWFERSEMKDRESVARRLRQHVEDSSKLPILIFPEGTCINNSAVMQFKKGSFEVGGVIYPVAIKYDPRFGDPFWNSSEYSMLQYLYMMMTSWAIVCDVYYLPPMTRKPGETAVDFANRVKSVIAQKGGLVDLDWDGQLKRAPAKREWKEKLQLEYAKKFTHSARPRHIVPSTDIANDSLNPST